VLDVAERQLCRLFTACVLGRWDEVERERRALVAPPDRAFREVVLMVHLFAGMPRQVEAYEVLDRAGGMGTLEPGEATGEGDQVERGRTLFGLIYGENRAAVEARLYGFHPDFGRFILGHAYGRVLAREGLTPRLRELLAVGALAAMGQERQLASHARGAVHAGASKDEVEAALAEVQALIEPERYQRGLQVVLRFARAKGQAEE
jgi:4-carboxymuconolactone decarboxylase